MDSKHIIHVNTAGSGAFHAPLGDRLGNRQYFIRRSAFKGHRFVRAVKHAQAAAHTAIPIDDSDLLIGDRVELAVETDMVEAADGIEAHIMGKRKALGI